MTITAAVMVRCDGCGKEQHQGCQFVENKCPDFARQYNPAGAIRHRNDLFYAFGYAWHLCGSCANEVLDAGLKRLQEIKGVKHASAAGP